MSLGPDFSLPEAKKEYSQQDFQAIIGYIRQLEAIVYKRNQHVQIWSPQDAGGREPYLVVRSPDGTKWRIHVDNAGNVTTTDVSAQVL